MDGARYLACWVMGILSTLLEKNRQTKIAKIFLALVCILPQNKIRC